MTVHHHDPDRVMALAAGSLSGAEARHADEEVAACDLCRSDLEAQRTALRALASLAGDPAARLTELEARRLGRAVGDELGVAGVEPSTEAPTPTPRGGFAWGPLVAVAAVFLAVVVGGNAIRSLIPSGGDDADTAAQQEDAADTDDGADGGAERASVTTAAAAEGEPELMAATPTSGAPTDTALGDAGELGTTSGAQPDILIAPELGASRSVDDLAELWGEVTAATTDSRVTDPTTKDELVDLLTSGLGDVTPLPTDDAEPCIGAAVAFVEGPAEVTVVGTVDVVDMGTVVVTVATSPAGNARLLLHAPEGCTVVAEVLPTGHP